MLEDAAESRLVARAQGGDPLAFDEIIRRERPGLLNLMVQLTGDPARADDLTQKAVLGCSLARVKTDLHRGRRLFRNQFVKDKCRAFADDYLCVCEGIADL